MALAASFPAESSATTTRQIDIFVLPDGFRVEAVYLPKMQPLKDLLLALKPERTFLHVCGLTPRPLAQEVFEALRALPLPSTPEVKLAGRNAIECAFPTDRERGGRGA